MAALFELRVSAGRAQEFVRRLGETLAGYDLAEGDVDDIRDALLELVELMPKQRLESMSEQELIATRRKINRVLFEKYLA